MGKFNIYDVNLKIDVKKQFLESKGKLKYFCKEDINDKLTFYIHKGLNVDYIDCNNLDRYEIGEGICDWSPFIKESKRIDIYFNKNLAKGEEIHINFKYRGQISKLKDTEVNRISEKWIELGIYSPWFLLTKDFEKAYFKVKISTNPKDYIVVGSNITKREGDYFIIDQMLPFMDCSFVASRSFNKNCYSRKINNIDMKVYYIDDNHHEFAKTLSENSFWILEYFNSTFGQMNEEEYSVVVVPRDIGGGYNRPGLIVLSDLINDKDDHFKYKKGKIGHFKYLAHEIAHLWWSKGNQSTWEDWLNESFAEYSCLIAIRGYYGEGEFIKLIDEYRQKSKNLPQIRGLDRGDEKAFDTLYVKGPVLLNDLENKIGMGLFNRLLYKVHNNNISNTHDFLDELAKLTNKDVAKKFSKRLDN